MNEEIIRVEKKGPVRLLILNRPDKRNALSADLLRRLDRVLRELAQDEEARALVIRGAGDQSFCAGFDLGGLSQEQLPGTDGRASHPLDKVFQAIEDFPCPVFAMLNGSAYGGGYELAACCDFRIAADDIQIAVTSAKLGIVYPWQGLMRFIQLLGPSVTKQLLFTSRSIEGDEIARLGLADYVVQRGELEDLTFRMAEAVAAISPGAIRGTKRAISLLLRARYPSEQTRAECDRLAAESWQSDELQLARKALVQKTD
jgi:enoyl-CoA hydratase/carnithine racemase